jgi:predicted MFS family arabinose efflux permease
MAWRRRGLLLHRDFVWFWAGESISLLGDQISHVAIPLTAVLVLGASVQEMGLLGAATSLPFLFFGLLAGVWADRLRRRPLLIATYLASATLIASIPVANAAGVLSMAVMYVVAFGAGTMEVIATAAYQAFLPFLVGRRRLVEANAKVELSSSVAISVGPSVAGILVQLLTAPVAVALDAASFLAAAVGLWAVRRPEPPPQRRPEQHLISDVREGLAVVIGDPRLRLIMLCGATHNFFMNGVIAALLVLFMVELGLTPAQIGIVLAATGPGVLVGAVLASRVPRRLGVGPTIAHMQTATGISALVLAAAGFVAPPLVLLLLVASQFLLGCARPIFNVTQVSLRQTLTPDRLLGRMNASIRFLMWAAAPLGAIVGGTVAAVIGLPETILLAALGTLAAAGWVYLPPVWQIREQPIAARTG